MAWQHLRAAATLLLVSSHADSIVHSDRLFSVELLAAADTQSAAASTTAIHIC
jgi:hypothetical protein